MESIMIQGTAGIRSHAQTVVDEVVALLRQDDIRAEQWDWTRIYEDQLAAVVCVEGSIPDGFRALALVLKADWPVAYLRRAWAIIDGELHGPRWEIVLGPFEP